MRSYACITHFCTILCMVTLAQTHVDGASNSMGMKPGHGLRGANEFPAFNENVTAFRTALTQGGFDWITDTAKQAIAKYFTTISIPPLSFEKLKIVGNVYDIECKNVHVSTIEVDVEDQVHGTVSGVSLSCSATWELKLDIWPHPHKHGTASADTSNAGANIAVGVSHDSTGHAVVSPGAINVDLGNLNVHIHGGVIGDILDFFKNLLQGWIVKHVEKSVENGLSNMLENNVNSALQQIPVVVDLGVAAPYNVSLVKVGITSVPHVSSAFIGAGLQGYFVDATAPDVLPPFTPPKLPSYYAPIANSSYLQLIVSSYMIESAFWVFQSNGLLQKSIGPNSVPPKFPLKLNTDDPVWLLIAPDMPSKYPHDEVNIVFEIQKGTQVSSRSDDNSFSVKMPLAMDIEAVTTAGNKSAFVLGCPLEAALKLSVKDKLNTTTGQTNQVIAGNMEFLSCNLTLEKSTVGPVKYSALKKGIPIPTGSFVELTNTSVTFEDDYAVVGSMATVNISKIIPSELQQTNFLSEAEIFQLRQEFEQEYLN